MTVREPGKVSRLLVFELGGIGKMGFITHSTKTFAAPYRSVQSLGVFRLEREKSMGMPRGLIKLTHAASTMAAWDDWNKLACEAVDLGVENFEEPNPQDGHHKIDKCIAALCIKMLTRRDQLAWEAGCEERARQRAATSR